MRLTVSCVFVHISDLVLLASPNIDVFIRSTSILTVIMPAQYGSWFFHQRFVFPLCVLSIDEE